MAVKQYRKKPVVIEAMQYKRGQDMQPIWDWAGANNIYGWTEPDTSCYIFTLEGKMECRPGDYIIKGVKGEFYPCKPDIFKATYELVE